MTWLTILRPKLVSWLTRLILLYYKRFHSVTFCNYNNKKWLIFTLKQIMQLKNLFFFCSVRINNKWNQRSLRFNCWFFNLLCMEVFFLVSLFSCFKCTLTICFENSFSFSTTNSHQNYKLLMTSFLMCEILKF